jgi:hypothetical protein
MSGRIRACGVSLDLKLHVDLAFYLYTFFLKDIFSGHFSKDLEISGQNFFFI